ncbi:MAG: hypothetical protein GEU26_14150 [Nitrososphaeraceae archaeon]|nr:hypothetical protein [Nitrososphaeraceae archaeon]
METNHKKYSSPYHDEHNYLISVAWAILVIGSSLAVIVVLWSFIGYIGPSYSADRLIEQQVALRDQYDLPSRPVITDPNELETPPPLRSIKDCIPYSLPRLNLQNLLLTL